MHFGSSDPCSRTSGGPRICSQGHRAWGASTGGSVRAATAFVRWCPAAALVQKILGLFGHFFGLQSPSANRRTPAFLVHSPSLFSAFHLSASHPLHCAIPSALEDGASFPSSSVLCRSACCTATLVRSLMGSARASLDWRS